MATAVLSGGNCDFRALSLEHFEVAESCMLVFVGVSPRNESIEFTPQDGQNFHQLSAVSTVDAIFVLKRKLDEAGVLDATIFVPHAKLEECEAVRSLLFMDHFKVSVLPFPKESVLIAWVEAATSQDSERIVTEYLTTVPSIGEVNTIASEIFPSNLLHHGYTTRWGGISSHPGLTSLSITYSMKKPDSPIVAKENKRRLCHYLQVDPERFHLCRVEHGDKIWVFEKERPEKYDGIVTNTPGVTTAAPGADCMMVLLADPEAKECGAVHAGFAGVLVETLKSAVNAMQREYSSKPSNILCSIGPCLGACCADYHKDPTGFQRIHADILSCRDGVPHVDLRKAARIQLERLGICQDNIDDGKLGRSVTPEFASCTKCESSSKFFSHRRDGAIFGNCIGFISLIVSNQL